MPELGDKTLLEAERRRMTVLFADLVGSTDMATTMDPEDYGEVIGRYVQTVEDVVRAYDGYVANYLGDGVLVYFGYPRAHEEDSCRACLAAIDIVEAVRALKVDVDGLTVQLAVRIGIHSGTAIIGALGAGAVRDVMAVGETLNRAARLQTVAQPNTALISAATERLVRRYVRTRHVGSRTLRGIPEPVDVYELVGVQEETGAAGEDGAEVSPLVGRDLELEVLLVRWEESRHGKGRVVVLAGEAGLGKSRLIRTLRTGLAPPFTWLLCRATPFYADTPLRPVVDALPTICQGSAYGVPRSLPELRTFLAELGFDATEAGPLLAKVLAVPLMPGALDALQLSPQLLRKRTLESLVELLIRLAHRRPMAFVVEDAHWLDETSLEFIDRLSEQAHAAPLLLLVSGRPAFPVPMVVDSEISLRRLPRDQAEVLMRNIARGVLTRDAIDLIAQRADGNPLYLEELTRTVLDAGTAMMQGGPTERPAVNAVPASLQELLMARVDHAAVDRTLIQAASAIGRAFSYGVIRELLPVDDARVSQELDRHVEDGLLSRRGTPPDATYTFRHALLRDAVYESITRRSRRQYHRLIAAALRAQGTNVPPEVVAHHYREAGEAIEAANYCVLAAQSALDAFALAEAMNHLYRGLALLEGDDRPDAVLAELRLRTTLGVPLMLTQGFASAAARDNYRRLLDRAEYVGEAANDALLPALWGLWTFYEVGVELPLAQEMGQRLLHLADRLHDSGVRLAGHIAYGAARMLIGDMAEARDHLERGLAVYDPSEHGRLATLFGQDGGAMCCSFLCWIHAHEGDNELGRRRASRALRMCEELGQPATWAFVGAVVGSFYCLIGAYDEGEAEARRVVALGESQGMPHWAAQGRCNLGWALTGKGRFDDAVTSLRSGLEGLTQVGARASTSYFRAALIEAHLGRGDLPSAQAELADLQAFVATSDERFYEAALWWLDGEVTLACQGPHDRSRAEESFRRAIEVAHSQGADALGRRAGERLSLLSGSG